MLTDLDVPRLETVARPVSPVQSDITVNQVIERFRQETGLLALPVLADGEPVGIISRRELFSNHLARPFARELYGRKPIVELLAATPLLLAGELDIHTGLQELLQLDPRLENDCLGVCSAGSCTGVVAVADLMMAISQSQAGLLDTLQRLGQRIRDEVELARQVQTALLPVTPLRHAGVMVAAGLVHSSEISGDVYDVFPLDEHRLGLLVADVTGHGVQAGLVTTAAKAGLQTLMDSGLLTPSQFLGGINRAIRATGKGRLLMTALLAIIDRQKGTATIASAGHPYPYHRSGAAGKWQLIDLDPGFPLGFDDGVSYSETTIPFLANDLLLLFSDGILEAENLHGEQFAEQRLPDLLQREVGAGPEELRDTLLAAARRFCGRDHFEDDVTLVVARHEGVTP